MPIGGTVGMRTAELPMGIMMGREGGLAPVIRYGLGLLVSAVALVGCGGSAADVSSPVPVTTQVVSTDRDLTSAAYTSSTGSGGSGVSTVEAGEPLGSERPSPASVSSVSATTVVAATTSTVAVPDRQPLMNGMFVSVVGLADSLNDAERQRAELEGIWPELGILHSVEYESLDPGSWIVYAGPFDTASEAQDACRFILNRGAGTGCVGQRLSQDPADRELHYPPAPAAGATTTTTIATTPDWDLSAQEIYRKIAPSVAYIVNGGGTGAGSGILIDGGYVVTNYHVVEPYGDVWRVVFPDGTEFWNIPVVGSVPWADLAVLGPVDAPAPPLRLGDGERMVPGSTIFLVGYPAEVAEYPEPSITQGVLSRTYEEPNTGLTVLRTDASAVGGQSGGAMIDAAGNVIGVTVRGIVDRGMSGITEAYSAADYAVLVDALTLESALPGARRDSESAPRSLERTFIAVVVSASSPAAAEAARDDLEADFWWLPFGILVSDDYASLNPGYWVVYVGPFAYPEEAQGACWFDLDMRTGSLCYGRRLSQDPADRELVYPPAPVGVGD